MASTMLHRTSRSLPSTACFNDSTDAKWPRRPSNSSRASRSASAQRCRTKARWRSISSTAESKSCLRGSSSVCSNDFKPCTLLLKSRRKAIIARSSIRSGRPSSLNCLGEPASEAAFSTCTDFECMGALSLAAPGTGPADGVAHCDPADGLHGPATTGSPAPVCPWGVATTDSTISRISFCQSSRCWVVAALPTALPGRMAPTACAHWALRGESGTFTGACLQAAAGAGELHAGPTRFGCTGAGGGATAAGASAAACLLAAAVCAAAKLVRAVAICESTSELAPCCPAALSSPPRGRGPLEPPLGTGDPDLLRTADLSKAGSARMRSGLCTNPACCRSYGSGANCCLDASS
mmetsp:Transcript_76211/g.181299  ORF Transcript_76211/g.181299 Transcript_76211/m.181299 type:complete len:351 (+) Transcript_76211:1343-2395(+)